MYPSCTPNLNIELYSYNDYPQTWHTRWNAQSGILDSLAAIGSLAVATTEVPSAALTIKVSAGTFRKSDGTLVSYAGVSSQVVTASATTWLWLTDAGVLATGTGFPASGTPHVRLAVVVAGGSTITSVTDARTPFSSSGATRDALFLTLAAADATAVITVHAGTAHGLQIGGAASDLFALWGKTPTTQPTNANQAAMASLTVQTLVDSSGGIASTAMAAITAGASYSQADMQAAQNAIASLAAQVNKIGADLLAARNLLNALQAAGVTVGVWKGS